MKIEVKRSARRSLSMELRPDGILLIRAPLRASTRLIDRFIADHESWVNKRRISHENNPLVGTPSAVFLLGRSYVIHREITTRFRYTLNNEDIVIAGPESQSIEELIIKFYKKEASLYLPDRVAELSEATHFPIESLRITSAKTRWGSCGRQRNIALTWRLMAHHPQVIDYVILHELAHIKHANHGRHFWALLIKWDPAAHQHRKLLKDPQFRIPF